MPPCGVPVAVSRSTPSSPRMPARRNAFTSARTRLSPIRPRTRPMRARWSISSKQAEMSASTTHSYEREAKIVDLGDRVLGPAPGPEAVGARREVRLEDRLQHQLERGLHHPVPDGRDAQPAALAAGLRDHPLAHRQRPERAGLEGRPAGRRGTLPRPVRLRSRGPSGRRRPPNEHPGCPAPGAMRRAGTPGQQTRLKRSIEPTSRDHRLPIGAAWSASAVPAPPPRKASATMRRCSPATSCPAATSAARSLSSFAL